MVKQDQSEKQGWREKVGPDSTTILASICEYLGLRRLKICLKIICTEVIAEAVGKRLNTKYRETEFQGERLSTENRAFKRIYI